MVGGGAILEEGAKFGGKGKVKATFGGGRLLGPTFLPELIQAIDYEEDLGQIPRSEGVYFFGMDQTSRPLMKS